MIPIYRLFERKDYPQKWGNNPDPKSVTNRFVIHEHRADRAGLHYDLRIEHNGVLKSWASRKMPQLVAGEAPKIQLFPTPDHDTSWFSHSGIITDGYGKGIITIWDTGSVIKYIWTDDKKVINFAGHKLKGNYAIINNLLIKMKR